MHTPAPLERPAWVVRIGEWGRCALVKSRQAWAWSRPRLITAATVTAYHGRRGARRLRLVGRGVGHRVMDLVNAFDAWWERSRRRPERRAFPPPPPPPPSTPSPRASAAPAAVPPRTATQRPTTGSIGRTAAGAGTGALGKPAARPSVRPTTGSISRPGAKPTTGTLAKPATGPLERTAKPFAKADDRRATGGPAAIHCWSCSTVTAVTGARRGGCYYCSRCGKLMTVLDLASGRTRAFTGRGEISADETEAGDD